MICASCHKEVWGVAIYGIMPWDRVEGRKPANVCDECSGHLPCGGKGYWYDGLLICKHGFSYTNDYYWEGDKAVIVKKFEKRKWWSYLIISNSKHEKLAIT